MCRVEFVVIAIRLLALGMGLRAFLLFGGVLTNYFAGMHLGLLDYASYAASTLFEAAVWAVAGVYCRQRAEKLAWSMFADDEEATSSAELGLTAEDLTTIGCIIAGLWVFVPAVRSFTEEAVWFTTNEYTLERYWSEYDVRARFMTIVLDFAVGSWMLFAARKASKILLASPKVDPIGSNNASETSPDGMTPQRDEESSP